MTFTAPDLMQPQPSEEPVVNHVLCEECRAPVALDQRYCVACGTRQTHADNPAVDYFATTATARRAPDLAPTSGRSGITPLAAVLLALLPLAVAAGVLVGRGTGGGNDDAALLSALRHQQPIVLTTSAGATGGSATTPSAGASTAPPKASTARSVSATVSKSATVSRAAAKHTASSTPPPTATGNGSSASGDAGKAIVQKEKSETGSGYVHGQSNLPSSITIPSS